MTVSELLFESDNEPLSFLTHLLGLFLAIAGLVVLLTFAVQRGTVWHVIGFSVFGASMVLLYAASALYHITPASHKLKEPFRRIDHSLIYVLIAGTYTPVCLITLQGALGWTLFGIVWALAAAGVVWKSVNKFQHRVVSAILYIAMGWIAVIAFIPLLRVTGWNGFSWLIAGGLFYTIGTIVFGFGHIKFHPRWFSLHDLWHLFVMAGSFCHFWFMLKFVL